MIGDRPEELPTTFDPPIYKEIMTGDCNVISELFNQYGAPESLQLVIHAG